MSLYNWITFTIAPFYITVLPCAVTSVQVVQKSDQTILVAKSYTLSSTETLYFELAVKLTPSCGYSASGWSVTASGPEPANFSTIDTDQAPAFVSSTGGSTIDFSAFSRDLALIGSHTISVTSTLTGYYFSPERSAPTCNSAFVLNIGNPCLLTKISIEPISVENLIAFAGFSVSSKNQYSFNDTES